MKPTEQSPNADEPGACRLPLVVEGKRNNVEECYDGWYFRKIL